MKQISLLSEIDYVNGEEVTFEGPIISVTPNTENEKRPIVIVLKLESSGEIVRTFTWEKNLLNTAEAGEKDDNVYIAVGQASMYKGEIQQIKLTSLHNKGIPSMKKVQRGLSEDEARKKVLELCQAYIPKNSIYQKLIDELILNNKDFWIWPAASRIHHAYPGGLAKHSIAVCEMAVSMWKQYSGKNLDIALLVAGALLHDIGKLQEYTKNGERTTYGNLISHLVSGYEKICSFARKHSIDPEKDLAIVLLSNIILSHHEKLEFGSPVAPGTLEATIIARADAADALVNTIDETLDMTAINTRTEKVPGLDSKILKWHN